ncbi:Jip4p [Saccharomyces eubayanus]|uniref:Jip4p n=1 Tax=Saccharomyces eubayanus TaxID=1080349 RepID=UPI0006C6D001|nr:JIP4-like protein [Saccharomyces eubayanus]KOH01280.1 JIP4-like protein [Saccharomyces eubayanus]
MVLRDHDSELRNSYKHVRLFVRPDQLEGTADVTGKLDEDRANNDDKRSLASILDSSSSLKKKGRSTGYIPCVSFNTVPRSKVSSPLDEDKRDFPGVQVPADYTMEEYYDDESGYASDNNTDYFSGKSYTGGSSSRESSSSSPGRYSSPPPASMKNIKIGKMFKISENGRIVREDYPTRPTDINDALVINRAYANWRQLWAKKKEQIDHRIEQKNEFFNYPTILFPPSKKKPSKGGGANAIKFNPPLEDGFTPLTKSQKRKERVLSENVGFPNTPRTILCLISGRKHTWVALDWALRTLVQNTDHIVVLANLPRLTRHDLGNGDSMSERKRMLMMMDDSRSIESATRSRSRSRSRSMCTRRAMSLGPQDSDNKLKHQSFMEWTSGYTENEIEHKLQDLFDYITLVIPKDRSVKVTVEILIGKTKKTLLEAINIYLPDFFVSSTLRWQRTDSLVRWKSNLLTDKLCTNFPIPTFIVPAKRMAELELDLQRQFADPEVVKNKDKTILKPSLLHSKSADASIPTTSNFKQATSNDYSIDSVGDTADSSGADSNRKGTSNDEPDVSNNDDVLSVKSLTSNVSVKEKLRAMARNRRESMTQQLGDADHDSSIPPGQRHLKKLDIILESSLKFSLEVETITDDTGSEDADANGPQAIDSGFEELKRVITGGAPPKHVATQKRSMLDVLDGPSTPGSKSKPRSRSKSRTREKSKPNSPIATDIYLDTNASRSRSSQIKFASTVKDADGHAALGSFKSKLSPDNTGDSQHHHHHHRDADQVVMPAFPELAPSKSYSVSSSNKEPSLRKVSSGSTLRKVKSNDSSSAKQRRKTPVNSTYLSPNSGGGGLFSFFKGKSRSSSPLRSQSEGKEASKRSGLFGFRKL